MSKSTRTVERVKDLYIVTFKSYEDFLKFVSMRRPSQLNMSLEGNNIVVSYPVSAITVKDRSEKTE